MRDSIQPLSLKISVLSLSLLFLAYPAQSQESSASLIEEIIVTSQRTEESLQDVPRTAEHGACVCHSVAAIVEPISVTAVAT